MLNNNNTESFLNQRKPQWEYCDNYVINKVAYRECFIEGRLILHLKEASLIKEYMDREWLQKEYHSKGPGKLAKELGVNEKTILYWVDKHGIPRIGKYNNSRKHHVNQQYFSIIDSQHKAYWLGFAMADACIYKGDSEYSFRFQINLALKDKLHLELFNKTIESDYVVKEKLVLLSNNKYYETCYLKIDNTPFCHQLIKHGVVPKKTGQETIPSLPDALLRHFIRGYFDGDGGISIHRNGSYYSISISSNLNFLQSLLSILESMGIATYCIEPHHGCWSFRSSNRQTIQTLYNYFYEEAMVYLDRKKLIFDQALLKYKRNERIAFNEPKL